MELDHAASTYAEAEDAGVRGSRRHWLSALVVGALVVGLAVSASSSVVVVNCGIFALAFITILRGLGQILTGAEFN